MRHQLIIGVAALTVLAGVGCSDSPSTTLHPAPLPPRETRSTPLVGVTWEPNVTWSTQGGELVRVDPHTLRPRPGPRIELGIHGYSWSYSPDRSRLVVGGFESGLRFVDLDRFEMLGDLRERRRTGLVVAVAWPTPDRVLAVVQERWGAGSLDLAIVDPVDRTVLEWRRLSGPAGVAGVTAGRFGLVLLLSPPPGTRRANVGPAKLLLIGPRGAIRLVALDRVWAGEGSERKGSRIVYRQWRPGLALDRVGRRFFVIAGSAPVAEIDLRTLRITYHELAQPVSLFGRLRNWLEPAAQAKGETEGPTREARWLGDGALAVSGFDARGGEPSSASGLKLIDTRSWAVRTIDGEAADFVPAGELLLAYGCCFRTGDRGIGMTAYDRTGRTVWHLFGRRPIHAVQTTGGRAYARLQIPTPRGRPPWIAVVDVHRGKVLRRVQTPWAQLLLPTEASMAEKEG